MKINDYKDLNNIKILTSAIISIVKYTQENIFSTLQFEDVGLFLGYLEIGNILDSTKTLNESKTFYNKNNLSIPEILDILQASRILYLSEYLCALCCLYDSDLKDTVYDELILRGAVQGFSLDAEVWELNIEVIDEEDWEIITNWKPDERFR